MGYGGFPVECGRRLLVQNSTTYTIYLQDTLFVDAVCAFGKIEMKTCLYLKHWYPTIWFGWPSLGGPNFAVCTCIRNNLLSLSNHFSSLFTDKHFTIFSCSDQIEDLSLWTIGRQMCSSFQLLYYFIYRTLFHSAWWMAFVSSLLGVEIGYTMHLFIYGLVFNCIVPNFSYLIASMGLQALWSLGLGCLDCYALILRRDLQQAFLMSLFVVGDWVNYLRHLFIHVLYHWTSFVSATIQSYQLLRPTTKLSTHFNL